MTRNTKLNKHFRSRLCLPEGHTSDTTSMEWATQTLRQCHDVKIDWSYAVTLFELYEAYRGSCTPSITINYIHITG